MLLVLPTLVNLCTFCQSNGHNKLEVRSRRGFLWFYQSTQQLTFERDGRRVYIEEFLTRPSDSSNQETRINWNVPFISWNSRVCGLLGVYFPFWYWIQCVANPLGTYYICFIRCSSFIANEMSWANIFSDYWQIKVLLWRLSGMTNVFLFN